MTVVASLTSFRSHLALSSLYRKWKLANPKEDAAIAAYWGGGARPGTVKSEFGLAFLAAADAYRGTTASIDAPMPYPIAPII